MRVIFEHGGFSVEQDASTGRVVAVVSLGTGSCFTQEFSPEKALEMTAAVNTAVFPYQQSARKGDTVSI